MSPIETVKTIIAMVLVLLMAGVVISQIIRFIKEVVLED